MERKLRSLERLPEAEASKILVLPSAEEEEEVEAHDTEEEASGSETGRP
jgi:hypothetical protein